MEPSGGRPGGNRPFTQIAQINAIIGGSGSSALNKRDTPTPHSSSQQQHQHQQHQQQQPVQASVQIRPPMGRGSSHPSRHQRFSIAQNPTHGSSSHNSSSRDAGFQQSYKHRKRGSPECESQHRARPKVRTFATTPNPHLSSIVKRHKTNSSETPPGVVEIGGPFARVKARPYSSLKKPPTVGIPSGMTPARMTAKTNPLSKFFNDHKGPRTSIEELQDTDDDEDLFPDKKTSDEKAPEGQNPGQQKGEQPAWIHKDNDYALERIDAHTISSSSSSDEDDRPMKTKQQKVEEKEIQKDKPKMLERLTEKLRNKEKKGKEKERVRERDQSMFKEKAREQSMFKEKNRDTPSKKKIKRDYTKLKPAPVEKFLAQRPKPVHVVPPPPPPPPPPSFSVLELYLEEQTWNQELTDLKMEAEGLGQESLTMDVTYYIGQAVKVNIKPCPLMPEARITIHLDDIHSVKYNESFQVLVFEGLTSRNTLNNGAFFESVAIKLDPLVPSDDVHRFLSHVPCSGLTVDEGKAAVLILAMGGERQVFEKRLEEAKQEKEKGKAVEEKKGKAVEDSPGELPLRRSTRLAATVKKCAFPDFGDTHHYQTKSGKQMEITAKDVEQLRECEYLNDTLISLFLQIEHDKLPEQADTEGALKLFEEAQRQAADKVGRKPEEAFFKPLSYSNTYVFSTYFVHKLLSMDSKTPAQRYQSMKKWTSKIDIFSKQCIVIPIVEHNHWYVVILWNLEAAHKWKGRKHKAVAPATAVKKELTVLDRMSPGRVTRSQSRARDLSTEVEDGEGGEEAKEESEKATISPGTTAPKVKTERLRKSYEPIQDDDCIWMFALDSLNIPHRNTAGKICDYIQLEAKERLKIDVPGQAFKVRDMPVPIQTNTWDCGVYLIHFVQMFFANPIKYLPHMAHFPHNKPKLKADFRRMWSTTDHILDKRKELVERVFQLKEGAASGGLRSKMLNSDMGEETPDDDSDDDVMITSSMNHSPRPKVEKEEPEKEKEEAKEEPVDKGNEKEEPVPKPKEEPVGESMAEEEVQAEPKEDVPEPEVTPRVLAPLPVPDLHETETALDVKEIEEMRSVQSEETKEDKMAVDVEDKEESKDQMDVDVEEVKDKTANIGSVSTPDVEVSMNESIDVDSSSDVEEIQQVHVADSSRMDVDVGVDVDEFDFDETPRDDSLKHRLLHNSFGTKGKDKQKEKEKDRGKAKTKWRRIPIFDRPQN